MYAYKVEAKVEAKADRPQQQKASAPASSAADAVRHPASSAHVAQPRQPSVDYQSVVGGSVQREASTRAVESGVRVQRDLQAEVGGVFIRSRAGPELGSAGSLRPDPQQLLGGTVASTIEATLDGLIRGDLADLEAAAAEMTQLEADLQVLRRSNDPQAIAVKEQQLEAARTRVQEKEAAVGPKLRSAIKQAKRSLARDTKTLERLAEKVDTAVKRQKTLTIYVCGFCGRSNCNYMPTWKTVVVDE